jgi:hypothetical protein
MFQAFCECASFHPDISAEESDAEDIGDFEATMLQGHDPDRFQDMEDEDEPLK